MATPQEPRTSVTLLGRLRQIPPDEQAWEEFVMRYSPRIHAWCRHWRLREEDIHDVSQAVLAKLAVRLRTFPYDPSRSFRAWLKTLTHHAWQDWVEGERRHVAGSGDREVWELLRNIAAREDLVERLDEEFDRELLAEAMSRVQLRVQPRTWEAFRLTAVEGLSGAEAAERLSMKVATVFVAKSKVQRLLQKEVVRLGGDPPAPAEEFSA